MRHDPFLARARASAQRHRLRFPYLPAGRPDLQRLVAWIGIAAAIAALALVPGRALLALVMR